MIKQDTYTPVSSDYFLVALACLSYFFNYIYTEYVFIFASLFIVTYYYILFTKPTIEVYIFAILAARTINAFVIINSTIAFNIVNVLISYVPFFFILLYSIKKNKIKTIRLYKKYKYSILLLIIYFIYLLFNINHSMKIFKIRVLPLLMFISLITVVQEEINIKRIIFYLRPLFFLSIVLFLMPNYITKTSSLYSEYNVLKEPINNILITFMGVPRNCGFLYDPRILGIIAYTCLLCSVLSFKYRLKKFDILLFTIVIFSTLSRGAIIVGLAILAGMVLKTKKKILFLISLVIIISVLGIIISNNNLLNISFIQRFSNTFLPNADNNALSQRSVFSNYALKSFLKYPLGIGLGKLKSGNITALSAYGGNASDAFWFILLAEIGIFGTIIFLLSTIELFYIKNTVVIMFIVAYCIQLIGTDIPDMGLQYFALMMIIHSIILNIKRYSIKQNYTLLTEKI